MDRASLRPLISALDALTGGQRAAFALLVADIVLGLVERAGAIMVLQLAGRLEGTLPSIHDVVFDLYEDAGCADQVDEHLAAALHLAAGWDGTQDSSLAARAAARALGRKAFAADET